MGEQADYMLNGDDCQVCGIYLGEGDGYARTCAACDEGPGAPEVPAKEPRTILCREHPNCERRFRTQEAATQHWVAKHE